MEITALPSQLCGWVKCECKSIDQDTGQLLCDPWHSGLHVDESLVSLKNGFYTLTSPLACDTLQFTPQRHSLVKFVWHWQNCWKRWQGVLGISRDWHWINFQWLYEILHWHWFINPMSYFLLIYPWALMSWIV